MTAQGILERAQLAGVCLHLDDGQVQLSGDKSAIAVLLPDLRNHRAELVQLLSKKSEDQMQKGPNLAPAPAPDWTPPAPQPDPGLPRLLALADRYCTAIQASDKARNDWRTDIEQTPPEQRGDLHAYLLGQLPPAPKPMPPAVVAQAPAPAPTWREADKADQLHYWSCKQCLAVVHTGKGARCPEGQRLSDAYIEVAARERFIGAKPDPAKPLPKFHVAQPWNVADRAYQAHHWNCPTCKANARSNGHSDRCAEGQHLYDLYEQATVPKEHPND